MPRCYWCRQESESAEVCDWCKRPMMAGWTPVATVQTPAAATGPTLQDEIVAADRNDRLLMFSMLGVVIMTIAALGYAYLTQPREPAPVRAQPTVSAPGQQPATQQIDTPPVPTTTQLSPPPVEPAPPLYVTPQPAVRRIATAAPYRANRKFDIFRAASETD